MSRDLDIEMLKETAVDEVNSRRQELTELSIRIHDNPETGFQELRACEWLTEYLERYGFKMERGVCGMDTAFRGTYGEGGPAIALLAEYDAPPELGHACGHNIICTAAVGAAVAVRGAVDERGGSVVVIGTPAEEMYGGKVVMAERGAFTDIDAAMMVHPSVVDVADIQALACIGLEAEFSGKAAHAAAFPQEGVNALEAMILAFNGINALRQHIRDSARIHGIITHGGEAPNVVPARSAGSFLVRAADDVYLEELKGKVLNCFTAAAVATGAKLDYRWTTYYAPLNTNAVLIEAFSQNMQSLGRHLAPSRGMALGSSDVGNVSALVPTIHPMLAIAPPQVSVHSPEFAAAAASEDGMRGMLDGAKALAMTTVDLISRPGLMARVKQRFLATA
jgi:amidohydrolase